MITRQPSDSVHETWNLRDSSDETQDPGSWDWVSLEDEYEYIPDTEEEQGKSKLKELPASSSSLVSNVASVEHDDEDDDDSLSVPGSDSLDSLVPNLIDDDDELATKTSEHATATGSSRMSTADQYLLQPRSLYPLYPLRLQEAHISSTHTSKHGCPMNNNRWVWYLVFGVALGSSMLTSVAHMACYRYSNKKPMDITDVMHVIDSDKIDRPNGLPLQKQSEAASSKMWGMTQRNDEKKAVISHYLRHGHHISSQQEEKEKIIIIETDDVILVEKKSPYKGDKTKEDDNLRFTEDCYSGNKQGSTILIDNCWLKASLSFGICTQSMAQNVMDGAETVAHEFTTWVKSFPLTLREWETLRRDDNITLQEPTAESSFSTLYHDWIHRVKDAANNISVVAKDSWDLSSSHVQEHLLNFHPSP
eukprot:CAMPEP_0198281434 /NCGR_PEP_ID=MMETSP1449-20131203/1375_1 /TAXON_ID=420275 /ORGANISM="Attheya septentrionalis, Strain CCMP2084" /LENGTH=418 /DNA_ID=CAMNT_0043977205 /DNA_START=171 /DNA_END=1427 /DNA_ORIENTATION=-